MATTLVLPAYPYDPIIDDRGEGALLRVRYRDSGP
jgi:hypothetical protein